MVATSQPLAAATGLRVLQEGGNAIDAAIATAAVLNVSEPMMCGIGGDLFSLVYEAGTEKLHGLNATGRAGSRACVEEMRAHRGQPGFDIRTVTVPGALDGWEQLRSRFGTLPLAELLAPAIHYAENGFPVSEIVASLWKGSEEKLRRVPSAASTYLPDGKAPAQGDLFKSPDLARTFRKIGQEGPDVFYRGELARVMAAYIEAEGGFVTFDDFASHHSDWVEPISTTFRGYTVYQMPPNSQGYVALEMLNILEGYDLESLGHNAAEYLHLLIEAKKLAFADRNTYLADPSKASVPVETLTSKEYATERRRSLDEEQAAREAGAGFIDPTETVYLTVVDEHRNVVSLIYSVFTNFGSGHVVPGTGITLQNRGEGFSLEEGHRNVVEPGKRALHTNMPAMVFKDTKPWLSYGVMGGDMQPQGHVQILLNLIEFGMNVQQAGEMPRFRHLSDRSVGIESGISAQVLRALVDKGHRAQTQVDSYGGYQAIQIDWEQGTLIGGSDPRKDGAAVGY